MLTNFVCSS